MNTMIQLNKHRHINISVDFDMSPEQLLEFTEQHLGYVCRSRSFHIAWVGEVRVLENYAGENFCYTLDIDFTDYIQKVEEKYSLTDEEMNEAIDHLMEHMVDQMISGSPVRKDNTQLVEGRPELVNMIQFPSYDVTPAPASDAIEEFKVNSMGANNVELYEMFVATLERVREEERAKADKRVEAVEKATEARIADMTRTLGNVVEILTKESKELSAKNENLSKLAGIPKFRRASGTRVVRRNADRRK